MHPSGKTAIKEALLLWAIAFAAIAIARSLGPFNGSAKAAAAISFLYLPGIVIWRRNQDFRDYGATLKGWKSGLLLGLKVSAIVLPAFALGFYLFVDTFLQNIMNLSRELVPYRVPTASFSLRLPGRFWEYIIDQFFVVALPEELFYRGFIQARMREAWPEGRVLWGARLGKAFWITQILFALGHLAEPRPWRLAVFFPSLLFGWMREKSGTILPGTLFHALSNLTILVLETSFFARV